MPIEPLEPRIAPAAGLIVTRLPTGGLNFTATDGDDAIFLRSDEPGWLTFGTQTGDLLIDGVVAPNPATIAMPKGAVTIDLLGGADQLFLNPMIIPGSLTVNDPSGDSDVAITGLIVRGALTLNGSSDDDAVSIDGRLSVGKDFKIELGSGTSDLVFNQSRGLSMSVGGNFRVHGTAETTIVALGLSLNGQLVRNIDNDPGTPEELDEPLELRDFRVGLDVNFEAAGQNAALYLGAGDARIGGRLIARATGVTGNLDYFHVNGGAINIAKGVKLEAGHATSVLMEALSVNIGGSFNLLGGPGDDRLTIFGNNTARLPKTTLIFGDGTTDTLIRARDAWSLSSSLAVTAGSGDDVLSLKGPGKILGNVTGDFGSGKATVSVNGDGAGRMNVGPLLKMTAQTQVLVGIYNSVINGRVEVTGRGGDDLLAFDSAKVLGPVVFTGGAGADVFLVDESTTGYLTPSAFLGPVLADMGDHADTIVLGSESGAGRATFFSTVTLRGIFGETYAPPASTVVFKITPKIS